MATRTIATPDPGFSGTRAGVVFREGVAVVDADNATALAYFARHGYPVDTPAPARRGRGKAKAAEPQDDVGAATDGTAVTEPEAEPNPDPEG
jgi:hypothetical protein